MTPAERKARTRALRRRYAHVPTVETMVRRLVRAYNDASDEQRQTGELWYDRFRLIAETLADMYGVTVGQAAGVLAITSPRVSVTTNVALARDVLATWQAGGDVLALAGLGQRLEAAAWYLAGDPAPLALDDDGLTRSRKVRSFWRNILGDTDAVTLDTWALRAVGSGTDVLTGGAYVAVATAYRRAAARLGVTPRDLQAIVWVVVRDGVETDDELDDLLTIATDEPTVAGRIPAPTTAV